MSSETDQARMVDQNVCPVQNQYNDRTSMIEREKLRAYEVFTPDL